MALSNKFLKTLNTTENLLCKQLMNDVREIFNTMVGLEDLLLLPVKIDPVTHFKDCISSLVGMAGAYNGLVSLHLPSTLAIKIAANINKMNLVEVNDDVRDAMGEITNIIAGSFKLHLSKSGLDIHLSTPSVIFGKEYVISLGSKPEQIALRFAADNEWFMVAVAFDDH